MPSRSRSGSTQAASTTRARRRSWPSTRTTRLWSASSSGPARPGAARPVPARPALQRPGGSVRDPQLGRGHPAAHRRHDRPAESRGRGRGAALGRPAPGTSRSTSRIAATSSCTCRAWTACTCPATPRRSAAFIAQLAPLLIHAHSLAALRWNAARALIDLVAGSSRLRKLRAGKKPCRMQENGRSTLPLVLGRYERQARGRKP